MKAYFLQLLLPLILFNTEVSSSESRIVLEYCYGSETKLIKVDYREDGSSVTCISSKGRGIVAVVPIDPNLYEKASNELSLKVAEEILKSTIYSGEEIKVFDILYSKQYGNYIINLRVKKQNGSIRLSI